jgi:23S rRNA (cytosine1962-C5)-methyltransferase
MPPVLAAAPEVLRTTAWPDYALLDSGGGKKLERYGRFRVVRPEPQCLWSPRAPAAWEDADAVFDPEGEEDEGRWRFRGKPPESFPLAWEQVRFHGRFTAFRHLAFFPEQAANWAWLKQAVAARSQPKILNLFGYTGVASLVAAAAGAAVTHVDASKKAVGYARENADLSGLADRPVRWIVEDARKYVARELRRGSKYDGIILDPPKFGRGPEGEVWRLEEHLPALVADCRRLLDANSRFLFLTVYAVRMSSLALGGLVAEVFADLPGRVEHGDLAVREDGEGGRLLPTAIFARWSNPG